MTQYNHHGSFCIIYALDDLRENNHGPKTVLAAHIDHNSCCAAGPVVQSSMVCGETAYRALTSCFWSS